MENILENFKAVLSLYCWNGDPSSVNAALNEMDIRYQASRWEPLGAAGSNRPRTVDFRTPYKRLMCSSERQLVELMMKMIRKLGR
ncbi:jg20732 [Pararge aegeria aegeria]|uniref:Jg20732 protein n=1 Tax=Pararge aegeria aegeria TaxID=348720 RepID=A0A8S4RS51_9NEOP|nr:jg20732 [Pararge aegeria aegeria]